MAKKSAVWQALREKRAVVPLSSQVEDFLSFNDRKTRVGHTHEREGVQDRLRGLMGRWSRQAPSRTLDPVTSWAAVIAHRHDCFKAVEASAVILRIHVCTRSKELMFEIGLCGIATRLSIFTASAT